MRSTLSRDEQRGLTELQQALLLGELHLSERRNENLPTFVVLPDQRGFASNGTKNWDSALLPAEHQGTIVFPGRETPIADLFPRKGSFVRRWSDRDALRLVNQLNREHGASRPGDSRLNARIRSYELAAKMQFSAPEALDISRRNRSTSSGCTVSTTCGTTGSIAV